MSHSLRLSNSSPQRREVIRNNVIYVSSDLMFKLNIKQ
jgi:hypothetical protein